MRQGVSKAAVATASVLSLLALITASADTGVTYTDLKNYVNENYYGYGIAIGPSSLTPLKNATLAIEWILAVLWIAAAALAIARQAQVRRFQ